VNQKQPPEGGAAPRGRPTATPLAAPAQMPTPKHQRFMDEAYGQKTRTKAISMEKVDLRVA
jgi:hypothetical protein